ncbi:LuxR C-terminal-related transcriptional regulator [Amycolatopsis sp. lyj-108]|uniref:LuxR C-terminal-related transcriptional regulator n=1 Tax=Amycolatopsis sp. lyj-108 TaxID=2789286 RepID=UPI003978A961
MSTEAVACVDDALATVESGRGAVVIAERSGVMGKGAITEYAINASRCRGITVAHGRATRADRAASLSTLVATLSGSEWTRQATADLGNLDGNRLASLDRLRERLIRLSAQRPLVLCLDDFHHADELTALSLRVLVPALASSPVLWLLVSRPSLAPPAVRGVVDALAAEGARRVTIGRLTAAELKRLCEAILGAVPDEDVLEVAAGGGGDPMLTEELVRWLLSAGQVEVRDRQAKLLPDAELLPMPEAVAQKMRARLSDLSEPVVTLLETGAVLGRTFTVHEVAGLTGRPATELVGPVTEAIEAGVLSPEPAGLRFRSELVRKALYAGLDEPVRMALHREAATVVRAEGREPDDVLDHLVRSGRGSLGESIDLLWAEVRRNAERKPKVAARLVLRLLHLLGDAHPMAESLTVEAVRLLSVTGDGRLAWELAERAVHRAADADTATTMVRTLAELAEPAHDWGGDNAVAEYTRLALARPDLTPVHRTELRAVQAYSLARSDDDIALAERAADDSLAAGSALGLGEAIMLGSAAKGLTALRRGEFDRSLTLTRAAVSAADRIGPRAQQRHPRLWLCRPLMALDRFDEVASTLTLARREARHLGTSWSTPTWHHHWARMWAARGAFSEAETDAEAGVRAAREQPAGALLSRLLCLLGEVRVSLGRLEEADANLREAEALAEGGARAHVAHLTWRRALWLWAAGREDEAAEVANGLHAATDPVAFTATGGPMIAPVLVKLTLRRGDRPRADEIVRTARDLAARNPGVTSTAAAAAHAAGLNEGDLGALTSAAELHRISGRRPARALALRDAGELAMGLGDHERAQGLTDEATRIHRSWSNGHGEQAPAETPVAVSTEMIPPVSRARWSNLTETELRVARLVAQGLTNKAVAAQLTLSRHTVDTHVRNTFTKLQVTNRVELALRVIAYEQGRHALD